VRLFVNFTYDMKKFTVIVLVLIYVLTVTGVSAEHFYCCGKLARTTFALGDSGNTVNNHSKKDDCCKTTKQSFKVKDQHAGSKTLDLQTKAFVALQQAVTEFQPIAGCGQSTAAYKANAPPERKQIPVYILNCTYRI